MVLSVRFGSGEFSDSEPGEVAVPVKDILTGDRQGGDAAGGETEGAFLRYDGPRCVPRPRRWTGTCNQTANAPHQIGGNEKTFMSSMQEGRNAEEKNYRKYYSLLGYDWHCMASTVPGTKTCLSVAQEQVPFPVVGPLQGPDLTHAAPCEEKQADERHFTRTPFFMPFEHAREPAKLLRGKTAFAALAPVVVDAGAGIAVFRPVAIDLGLAHDDGQDRRGPVRRRGRRAQGCKPSLHVLPRDFGDDPSAEPWKDLLRR